MDKKAYKLKLLKKLRIHNIFHVSLLEQNITKKRRVGKNNMTESDISNEGREYKIESIWDSAVYARELKSGYH